MGAGWVVRVEDKSQWMVKMLSWGLKELCVGRLRMTQGLGMVIGRVGPTQSKILARKLKKLSDPRSHVAIEQKTVVEMEDLHRARQGGPHCGGGRGGRTCAWQETGVKAEETVRPEIASGNGTNGCGGEVELACGKILA